MEESEAQSVPPSSAVVPAAAESSESISTSAGMAATRSDSGWPDDDDELATLPGLRRSVRPAAGASVEPAAVAESASPASVTPTPATEEDAPAMVPPDSPPALADSAPAIMAPPPAVTEFAVVAVPSPALADSAAVAESTPSIADSAPVATSAVVAEPLPAEAESPPAEAESPPADAESPPADAESPPADAESPPAEAVPSLAVAPSPAVEAEVSVSEPVVLPALKVEALPAGLDRSEVESPTIEVTSIADDDGQELISASSISAQVVPIHKNREKRKRHMQKARAMPVAATPIVVETAATPAPSSPRGYWTALVGAAALVGWWMASGTTREPAKTSVAEEPAAAHQFINAPAAKLEPATAAEPQVEPIAAQARPAVPEVAKLIDAPTAKQPAEKVDATEAEPARLTAYKSVMAATKSAESCRHRGDAAGKVPVVVEFGEDGRVQRTKAKGTFANPMTSQCIVSKFSPLTILATLSAPIIITADVTLR